MDGTALGWWATEKPFIFDFLRQTGIPWLVLPCAVAGAVIAIVVALRKGLPFVAIVIVFGLVQVSAYSLLGAPSGYFWYLAPGNLSVNMAIVFALFTIGGWLKSLAARRWFGRFLGFTSFVGPACVLLAMAKLSIAPFKDTKPYRLAAEHTEIGKWISDHSKQDVRVACAEIGYIGYYSKRRIRDIHGLLDPGAIKDIKKENWTWWIDRDPPEPETCSHPRSPWVAGSGPPCVIHLSRPHYAVRRRNRGGLCRAGDSVAPSRILHSSPAGLRPSVRPRQR